MAVLGLWSLRRTVWGRIMGIVSLFLLVGTLMLPGDASLWGLVYLVVPGAKAIRAVARVGMILIVPISVGAASFLDESRWKKPLLVLVALISILEQGRSGPTFDRREQRDAAVAIAQSVDPASEAFFYSCAQLHPSTEFLNALPGRVHVDAMMASLEAGKPTLNGHSGWNPPGWNLEIASLASDEGSTEQALQEWCRKNGLDRRRIHWVHGPR
jgi:hypothetical protein